MPADYAAFERYWDHMINDVLVAHRTAKYGIGYVTKGFPRPKESPRWPGNSPRQSSTRWRPS